MLINFCVRFFELLTNDAQTFKTAFSYIILRITLFKFSWILAFQIFQTLIIWFEKLQIWRKYYWKRFIQIPKAMKISTVQTYISLCFFAIWNSDCHDRNKNGPSSINEQIPRESSLIIAYPTFHNNINSLHPCRIAENNERQKGRWNGTTKRWIT